jgi:hypothetical protein
MSDKLIESFNYNRQDALKKKLTAINSLQEVADILREELTFYADIEGDYINSLTPSQVKTALALLAILRDSHDTLGDSVRLDTCHLHDEQSSKHSSESAALQNTVVITVAAGVGAGFGSFGGPIGGFIGAVVASASAKLINDSFQGNSKYSRAKQQQKNQFQLEIEIDKLISELINLFKKIDQLVLDKESVSQPKLEEKKPQLTDFAEFIGFIQKLAGQRYSGLSDDLDFAMQEELPSLLRRYGIEIDELSSEKLSNLENLSRELYHSYNIETSSKLSEPILETPAIFKDEQIFLKGKIRIPSQSK